MLNFAYLIVGDGRLARHLRFYFDSLAIPYVSWHRNVHTPELFQTLAKQSTRILLAISDKAIESFIFSHPEIEKSKWVHLSGALSLPGIYSAHPLGSFGEKLNPIEWYRNIFFVVEQQAGLPEVAFSSLLPNLPNPHAAITSQNKAYYHSLCVLSNNFSTILFQKLFLGLERELGIPKEAAYSYLRQTVFNLENTASPLTGPLVRKDKETIEKNLHALKVRQDAFADIYQAFVALSKKITINNLYHTGKIHEHS